MPNLSHSLMLHLPALRRARALARVSFLAAFAAVACTSGGDDGLTAPARLSRGQRPAETPAAGPATPAAGPAGGPGAGPGAGTASQLLACPTHNEVRASAWIGPTGGSVEARGATLTLPPGAVAVPTLFEVVVPESPTMTVDIHAVGAASYHFLRPATITLNFARCPGPSAPLEQLQGAYVDVATGTILEYLGGTVDKSGKRITFTTSHLSGYAIAY